MRLIRAALHGLRWRLWALLRLYGAASWSERAQLTRYAGHEITTAAAGGTRSGATAWIRLGGLWFCLEPRRYELAGYLDVWVRRLYEALPGFTPRAGTFVVDVGANVGFFALRAARAGARVVAIEPNAGPCGRLQRAIERNGLSRAVTVECCAAGAAAGYARLVVGRSTLTGTLSATGQEAPLVEVRTLDAILAAHAGGVMLLKIDTEGSEYEILRGASSTLARTERVVLEHHSPELLRTCRELLAASGLEQLRADDSIAYFARTSASATAS